MNRRGFLRLVGQAAAAGLILPGVARELILPQRTFVLPPADGWPVSQIARLRKLILQNTRGTDSYPSVIYVSRDVHRIVIDEMRSMARYESDYSGPIYHAAIGRTRIECGVPVVWDGLENGLYVSS